MNFNERSTSILGNKWVTEVIPNAPYVTDPKWMDKYRCKYVIHGDDITTDANGNDCYGIVRDQGRLKLVKRTNGVSTTDLINILLSSTKDHYEVINQEFILRNEEILKKFGTGFDGESAYNDIYYILNDDQIKSIQKVNDQNDYNEYIYIKGSFDLFNPFHIKALEQYKDQNLLIGIYKDGYEFTTMNILQRSLCVLQCKYVKSVIIGVNDMNDELIKKQFKVKNIIKIGDFNNEFNYLKNDGIKRRIQNDLNKFLERQQKKSSKTEYEKILESQQNPAII
ncbi:hypothetical protein WICMUC_001963 [Wickerhamomyces mucosus]|uniref:ethanolamine-phosphate cytidylyltransferase n=1 Tax=Wickerhamomyces mucosus TaxID=1378264 RepID=A0A9P8PRN1_9ASCO|nr:hypothetical protein WICMUC_001963 [Wickerhamomyces mucosus]